MIKVCFVCMGNICRSPTAEGTFRELVANADAGHLFEIDSAGTHAYHQGEAPDRRSIEAAAERGIDISGQRARQIQSGDYLYFDYLLAMDRDNLEIMRRQSDSRYLGKLSLFLPFAKGLQESEVPDPYYGGEQGFTRVLDLVEQGAQALLRHLMLEVQSS